MLHAPSLAPQWPGSNPAEASPRELPPPFARPIFAHKVSAGFPSPAEDYAEGVLDLNDYLVTDPGATTFVTLPDDALQDRGIRAGDILIVHRGLPPKAGDLVWAELDGQTLLRELRRQGARYWLCAHHPDFPPLYPREGQELRIRGVVTAMVRALYPPSGRRWRREAPVSPPRPRTRHNPHPQAFLLPFTLVVPGLSARIFLRLTLTPVGPVFVRSREPQDRLIVTPDGPAWHSIPCPREQPPSAASPPGADLPPDKPGWRGS